MSVILQHDNSQHKYRMQSKLDSRIHFTSCGIIFAGIGQKCPDKDTHKEIFPNCNLHTKPTKCVTCYA